MAPGPRRRFRALGTFVALVVWAPATAFFATIAILVARRMGEPGGPQPLIADLKAALVTTAYSLGGAAAGLGLACLVLPRARAHGLFWSAALWLCATAMLLVTRRVGGWPLLVAAVIAVGIGVDVIRRLVLALVAAWRAEPA
ncbi:MAG TPA: hypothetical protein VL383_16140 [Gemmatimonadaceae bacterium]|jgi:hypothetical protein|nr:hypothetical protein [Gemmatimonadaceae bacterium]